jgi:2-polyprenyl-3-methyl-5-hydroxy-6-metoxy-1,4-benzoquinol methylase
VTTIGAGATALELVRVEACPLCGSRATKTWRVDCRDWQQPQAPDRFEYRFCPECSAHFLSPRPAESELAKVYFEGYGPYQSAASRAHHRRAKAGIRAAAVGFSALGIALGSPARRRLARRLERIYTPESEGDTLLDYGCGSPAFLDEARKRGFATVGADFAEAVVEAVKAHGHEAFLVGPELQENVPDRSVGCVRMNHVIEHLYSPREALTDLRAKLRPGGRIHISTPNPGSLGSRLFRRRWHALDCPRHVVLYRPRVLQRLLGELGFHDVSIVHEAAPKDLARSWGIVLYDRGRIPHEQIEGMRDDPVPSRLFLPVASVAALVGVADRYHVFARA